MTHSIKKLLAHSSIQVSDMDAAQAQLSVAARFIGTAASDLRNKLSPQEKKKAPTAHRAWANTEMWLGQPWSLSMFLRRTGLPKMEATTPIGFYSEVTGQLLTCDIESKEGYLTFLTVWNKLHEETLLDIKENGKTWEHSILLNGLYILRAVSKLVASAAYQERRKAVSAA